MNRDTTQKERFEELLKKANLSYQELLIRILRQTDYSNPYETAKKKSLTLAKWFLVKDHLRLIILHH